MITIRLAGINIGIDNKYDHKYRFDGYYHAGAPDFTISVTEEELDAEYALRPANREYLEFVCIYRKIAEHLTDYDAFVFHGAVIQKDNSAFLFTAPSGTGKTTHVRLWLQEFPGSWVLNGDKPILRLVNGQVYACGTPWLGKEMLGHRAIRPLRGVCLLNRAPENTIRPATAEEIGRFAISQSYQVRDPKQIQRQLALIDACFSAVPVYTLHCNMEPEAAHVAWETLRKHLPRQEDC